jgi:hypothetical protein
MNDMTPAEIKTYVEVLDNGGPCPACGRDWHPTDEFFSTAQTRTHTTDCPVWEYMNDGTLDEDDDEGETAECPAHGKQNVQSEGVTQGSDPYSILHLACGDSVVCMGPGEPNTIIGQHKRGMPT